MVTQMILAYKGKSFWPSKCIEWMNWSEYSHVAWLNSNHTVTEAWAPKVRNVADINSGHTNGTQIDIFSIPRMTNSQRMEIDRYLFLQVGMKYDWAGVFKFLPRVSSAETNNKWFCSELIFEACQKANLNLLERIPPYKVYPGMVVISPLLAFVGTHIVENKNGRK
jgi:uncharacterized protein YycO